MYTSSIITCHNHAIILSYVNIQLYSVQLVLLNTRYRYTYLRYFDWTLPREDGECFLPGQDSLIFHSTVISEPTC